MENVQKIAAKAIKELPASGSANAPNPHRRRRIDIRGMLLNKEMQAAILSGVLMLGGWALGHVSAGISVLLYIMSYAAGAGSKRRKASKR